MNAMSMRQALLVWHELEMALQGKASHGDVTEIYAYRLTPTCPSLEGGLIYKVLENPAAFAHNEAKTYATQTKNDLIDVCEMFEQTAQAEIRVKTSRFDSISLEEWKKDESHFIHRVHLHVSQKGD